MLDIAPAPLDTWRPYTGRHQQNDLITLTLNCKAQALSLDVNGASYGELFCGVFEFVNHNGVFEFVNHKTGKKHKSMRNLGPSTAEQKQVARQAGADQPDGLLLARPSADAAAVPTTASR